ncbi:MAG: hypothetical protein ABL963_03315 [Longimicrobiales bacterium]
MSARFRIRTSSGQEISFASLEVFTEFVGSGDLAPDDVVYDAETKEWSSAATHPVVLQMRIESEEAERAATVQPLPEEPAVPVAELAPPPAPPPTMGEIGLDLAPAPSQMTPDQESAAFVARMDAERASDLHVPADAPIQSFTMDQGGAELGEQVAERVAPRRVEPRPDPFEREAPSRGSAARHEVPVRTEAPVRTSTSKPERTGSSASRYAPFVIVVLALGGAAVYFGPELLTSTPGSGNEPAPGGQLGSDEPPPEIADNEDTVRRRAQERFLSTTQTALRGLDPIPDVWLRGQYLAAPSDYPNVRAVWDEYLTTIRDVRARDDERYEAAYMRALDDARVSGDARAARLATAATDFRSLSQGRALHYDRVEALATVALRGHDALVQAEGTIAYEPASGPAVSNDPVIEATGRGPEAQALLEQVLDMILAELRGPGGPGQAANVREWVWTGFLDAVTNR